MKYFLMFILIAINFSISCCAYVTSNIVYEEDIFDKPKNIAVKELKNILYIKIQDPLPPNQQIQKKIVLKIINKHFNQKYNNITIEWSPKNYSYGKIFILPGIYLNSYNNNFMSKTQLLNSIISTYKIENICLEKIKLK